MLRRHFLFINRATSFGGVESCLSDWLSKVDYSKTRVTILNTLDVCHAQKNSPEVERVNINLESSFSYLLKWIKLLKTLSPDTIVFNQGDFFGFSYLPIILGFISTKGNVFLIEHSAAPEPPEKVNKRRFGVLPGIGLWRQKLKVRGVFARRILAFSQGVQERLLQWGYPKDKILVISHGVDTNMFCPSNEGKKRFRKDYAIPDNAIVLISSSRLERVKRLDRLVNAFNTLCKEHNNLWLVIVGVGSLEKELKKSIDHKERALFLGFVERPHLSNVLKGSDVFVLPSDNEGFGLSLVEAMSTGLLCVATKVPGPAEIIEDGVNGVLCEKKTDAVLTALRRVLSVNSDSAKEIRQRARQTVLEKYNIVDQRKRILSCLELPFEERAIGHVE